MLDWLTQTARANPDAEALTFGGNTITYAELSAQTDKIVAWLAAHQIKSGDHVGVLMNNRPEYVILIHALMRLGAVLVPLNVRLTLEELAYQINKARVRTVVIWYGEHMNKAIDLQCRVIDIARADWFSDVSATSREIDLNAPQAIVFTSGTSGRPKGAVLTYANQYHSAIASAFRIGTLPSDRWLCVLPLYHVGGLAIAIRCALYGTTINVQPTFNLEWVNQAIDTQGITLISLVPTMLYRLIEARTSPMPPALRLILLGGAAADPELVSRCQALNIPIATTYGLTEACSQVATQTPTATETKPASVGKAVTGTQVRILDENGQSAPNGQYGELVVSGPTVMQGYYDEPEATAKAIRNGALYTGDIGYIDEEGDLWLVQRRSDLIVSGGENVYPAEVEAALRLHPAVKDVSVVGIDNPEWGQIVAAAVVAHEGSSIDISALQAHARDHLAGYKIPRIIRLIDALPLTASGKIERKSVAKLFEEA